MKKILIITTGGTIGSRINGGVISAHKGSCRAVELYCEKYHDTEFETVCAMDILSENLNKNHLESLLKFIRSRNLHSCDGIIITHGSDTLSYSSAFLGMCLCGLDIPVVITAADRVPDDPMSNAVDNIRGSVLTIRFFKKGVFTVYKNPSDSFCSIYLATRIQEADRVYGAFSSFDGTPLGRIVKDSFCLNSGSLSPEQIAERTSPLSLPEELTLCNNVLMVRPYPGADSTDQIIRRNTKAVLYITYHSSSASAQGEGSALSLLKRCRRKGIGFYLASFGKTDLLYESSDILLKNGAFPLPHISDEAAYSKLLLCVNLPVKNRYEFMKREIFCEYL